MSQKIAQGKAGIVATKKSDPLNVSNALLTDSQNKSVSNESLASEMETETVIIRGTDFAKEFEKPNDRASHVKIGRAKQKVNSGGQGSILQCTSVSGVTSTNAGKPTATPPKTAAKPPDGPSRTSDLEGSAGNAVKSALKKATPTGTASITAPPAAAKTGNVAVSKANVNISPKAGNITNASKPNNMLPRPTPPTVAVIGRTVEVAANIGHRPNFPNMRSTIQAPGAVFPGVVQPRGRGPGANFSPQRPPASRMPANLFNAGRPGVQVMNVRNPLPMTPPGGFNAVRSTIGIATRPSGPMPVRLASVCPVNKLDVRRPNATNSAVRQRPPLVPDKPGVKPCLTPSPKPVALEASKVNNVNDVVNESGKKGTDKTSPAIKINPMTTTTTSVTAAPIKPTEGAAIKTCNHETIKPVDNVPPGGNKTCSPQGVGSTNNTVKTAGKPIGTKTPQSGGNQDFKVSSNNTTGNKTVKPTTPDGSLIKLQPSNTCDNVGAVKPNQPSATTEKEQTTAEPAAGMCDNSDVLDDGSKGGISFSFNRKLGQKLASSVPFGKEDDKARNSVSADKDSKTDASKEDSCAADKSQDSNKEMPSAGMSFLKVLNKERTLELDWPVEMIQYTKTQPSISFSCNPLFFDFKELLTKDKSQKEAQLKTKPDGDASISKTQTNNAGEKDDKDIKNQSNADDSKSEKPSVRKSRKKKRKLSSQRQPDDDESKMKKKKKKKHSSKKREGKSEGGTSEKDDDKKSVDASKSKRRKKKKKRSHHSAPKSDLEQGHGEGGDGDVVNKSKTSHKSKHKKHKSRKSKKKRHKHDEFEKDSNTGHESEEDVAASAVAEQKNKNKNKRKSSQPGKESCNYSSDEELSKVQKAKPKPPPPSGTAGEKVVAATSTGDADVKLTTAAVGDEDKDVCKKRNVATTNPQTLESVDESKKKKDEANASKPGSCTERKRSVGEVDSPVGGKKRKLSSKNPCLKSEDTWSKMETIFEARSDPDGNKASWDTSSDSDVASHENKPNPKSKSTDAGKRKKVANPSQPSDKPENNHNPMSKMSGASSGVKVEPKTETLHNSSGSDSDHPASAKQAYKRKKSYSGESHHSDGHCRSRDRSYSSSYSDRDSHYSDKSKHRHSRSHSSSRSRSRSRSASYERHSSRRGRRYSYSSYSDEDYRYRRGHSRSRSCSRRRSRTRSRSYSRSRRYRSYSSEHHRSYSSSSSRSRSRSESRGRSRSYSYSRSHSKSTSYSRSRSRSRSYHKSHSRSRSPHKSSSKQDYRHKSSPERSRYYSSSKKNSKHVSGGKGENEKGGSKLDPAKIPLPIMPGDVKEEPGEQGPEKSKDCKKSDTSKATTPTTAAAGGPEVVPNLNAVRADLSVASGSSSTGEPEAKSGLINIPLPPFQVAENAAQLGKVDNVDGQLQPPPPPPHMLSLPHYSNTGEVLMHHPIPDLSQPPPSTSLMPNCPPPPPPPPPPMLNNNGMMGAPSLYGHLSIPQPDVPRMNAPPPPPPPSGVVDPSMRMPLPFTPRSVSRHEQTGGKEMPGVSKSPIEATLQQAPPAAAAAAIVEAEKEMTPPLPPPKSPPPQPPPPPKKEEDKKGCEEISPMQPIIPPEQVEQYKHLQEMAQKHAMKQQRRQRLKDTGQPEESDDDESMEMEGQVSTIMSDEECDEQPGILALPEPEPQHLQRQILLPHAQHAGSPVIAQHMVPFSQQQIIIPPSSLLQSQGAFPIQTGGPMYAIPHSAAAAAAAHHHHHHHHHPLAGHHHHAAALHHAFHPAAAAAAAAGVPLAAASHPFHHQLIAAAPGQLLPYSSPQPILTQYHPPGPIIIGHQVLIPRFPRTPM